MNNIFIERKFQDIKNNEILPFCSLLNNNISVVLGEPASGKTKQLKQFEKENSEDVHFVELVNIESENNLELIQNKKYILLDSIDEALRTNNINSKQLQNKLTSYIQRCKKMNPEIKFVITCRQFEWKEYFNDELKKLDNELVVYQILDLEKDDINELLTQNGINQDEFWKYISDNFLDSLLKNILIVQYIIENYNEYKTKAIIYIDIYIDIIKRNLSIKGKDREDALSKDLPKDFNISSSLATYMILNRKATISIDNLSVLADELYKIDNKDISSDELNVVLSTALFKKNGNEFDFFHTSIKEFLMAHFINEKKLDTKTIKELFSHEMRFYEEFEEVIIYLTNLNEKLFDEFVEFDPFIFKRHPNLNNEQQEKLLISMLNKLKNEKSMAWGRWHDFDDTTLVRLDKLTNLSSLIQSNIKSSEIDKVIFAYLMAILEYNYSQELEDLIFKYLDEYSNNDSFGIEEYDEISDSKFYGDKKLKELIEYCFIDHFNFNCRLLEFLKAKKLLNTNKQKISTLDLETKLFESLYGIKYIKRYGETKQVQKTDTGFEFKKLLELLDAIPVRQLEYIVPYFKDSDTLIWLEHINAKSDRSNYHVVCWCIYAVLLHNNSKDAIKKIFKFLITHLCYMDKSEFDKIFLDFEQIADSFWEVYFLSEHETLLRIDCLVKLLRISLKDIKKAVLKYPIENYLEHYMKFRLNEDIDKYLMENSIFEAHVTKINKYWQEQREKDEQDFQKELLENKEYQQGVQEKANHEKKCKDSLRALATKQDFYNVFMCERIFEDENKSKLHELFTKEQHQKFLDFIERDFLKDEIYKEIKNNINNNGLFNLTLLYIYLFQNSDNDKIIVLIQFKENFEKIFFHTFKFHKIQDNFFVFLVTRHFDYFVENLIELIKLLLEQSQNKDLAYLNEFNQIIEKIEKFNQNSLSDVIRYLVSLDQGVFKSIKEEFKVEEILKIISLDKQTFDYIDELRKIDIDKASLYLEYLFKIDAARTLESYFLEYQKEQTYIKFYKLKKFLGIKIKDEDDKSQYDKQNVLQSKIKLFKDLVIALKKNKNIDSLQDEYLLIIIKDYYEFFYAYERPTGAYQLDSYDGMYNYINYIWNTLSADSSHIELLQQLSKSRCSNLSNTAKYHLQQALNNQNKDRSHPNSYYKKIFDKENIVNVSKITKFKNTWGELTMFGKIGVVGSVASIIGLVLYFIPSSSSSNNININNNNQSPIIRENHGNIIYNIDNYKNQTVNNNIQISHKIDNLINVTTVNMHGKNKEEQKSINTKIFILGEAKKINEKNISINDKNKECKNQASNAKNLFNYDEVLMHKICDEIF